LKLAVFSFRDILKFGRETFDTAQRITVGELLLLILLKITFIVIKICSYSGAFPEEIIK